jgi:putative ABC transport system ATP-binding protein
MQNLLIEVKNLKKIYDNEGVRTVAVDNVSFTIEKGEFVAIMGPSGSGKSTLMQMLGFLDRPSSGKYYFEGTDTTTFSDDDLSRLRNKKIGFVFQTFNLLPRMTVFENVQLPLLYDEEKESQKVINARVEEALKSVGILGRKNYKSNQLSGGERQRVAIARALIMNPEVIFADEPTGNLDSKNGIQVMRILQKLNSKGNTIVLVTHETATAQHAKRMISMMDGKIISDERILERRFAGEEKDELK